MQVKITDQRVRKNVELFLHLLSRSVAAHPPHPLHQRIYKAFINRRNGEVLFDELLPEPSHLVEKEWKLIALRCGQEGKKLLFEVIESEKNQECFHCDELAPLAYQVVSETVHTLNACIQLGPQDKDPDKQLADLSELSIESSDLISSYDLIQATWHPIDRVKAELLLFTHPYGSFIFRKDGYASLLEQMLTEEHRCQVTCFTLTFMEPERKVCDLTIVSYQDSWLIYADDPSLSGKKYPHLNVLLSSLKKRCKYPIFLAKAS